MSDEPPTPDEAMDELARETERLGLYEWQTPDDAERARQTMRDLPADPDLARDLEDFPGGEMRDPFEDADAVAIRGLVPPERAGDLARARHEQRMKGDPAYREAFERAERETRQHDDLKRAGELTDPDALEDGKAWE